MRVRPALNLLRRSVLWTCDTFETFREEGAGRTQVRGESLQELRIGVPVYAAEGVVHWHGAAPDEHLVQLTFSSGETTWFEPVSESDYLGGRQ